ncbi:hypothetical protein AB0H18_43095 [Streptomyces sp. NPDC020766]|uniref:Zn-ribbon domain-containing OB-fold protein n=1 Tax=Streptomyces sp. NPDC020766 TaxID=3155011 RepID=UPI0033CB2A64
MLQTDTLEHALEHTESVEDREAAAPAPAPAAATSAPATPNAPALCRDLFFQRCLWCGTPAYRRSFCRACGSVSFTRERSEGSGVVVRRNGQAPHHTCFVAMDEGFNLLCEITATAPVAVGARVSVVRSVAPLGQGLPLVELTAPPLQRRW